MNAVARQGEDVHHIVGVIARLAGRCNSTIVAGTPLSGTSDCAGVDPVFKEPVEISVRV